MKSHQPLPSLPASKDCLSSFLTGHAIWAPRASSPPIPDRQHLCMKGSTIFPSCVRSLDLPLVTPQARAASKTGPAFPYATAHPCSQGRAESLKEGGSVYFISLWVSLHLTSVRQSFPLLALLSAFTPKGPSKAPAKQAGANLGKCCLPTCKLESQLPHY